MAHRPGGGGGGGARERGRGGRGGDGSRRLTYEEKVASDMDFARQRLDKLRERYDRRSQLLGECVGRLLPAIIIAVPCSIVQHVRLVIFRPWECS